MVVQVIENVIEWQLERYANSNGKNLLAMTMEGRRDLKVDMIRDLYPGSNRS